jgi:ribosome modulation factor
MTVLLMETATGSEVRADDVHGLSTHDALGLLAGLTQVRADLNVVQDALRDRLERARAEGDLDGGSGNSHGIAWKRTNAARWSTTLTAEVIDRLDAAGIVPTGVAHAACPPVTVRRPDGKRLSSLLLELGRTDPAAAADLAACNQGRPYWRAEVL